LNNLIKRFGHNAWLEWGLRVALGVTFIVASIHKIAEPAYFAKIIYGYYLFPGFLINLIAIILPYIELFAGLALVLGVFPRSAVLIVNVLLLFFILSLSVNLVRGHEFDCGCFSFTGSGISGSTEGLLVRDVVYLIGGLYLFFFTPTRKWCLHQNCGISVPTVFP